MNRRTRAAVVSLGMLAAAAGAARGQSAPTWVPLNPAVGPGTPPTVTVNAALCTPQQTVVDVVIPGFYSASVVKPGQGTFAALTLPGRSSLETMQVPGKPALPVINMMLGIPTDAATISVESVVVNASSTLTGYGNVMPDQPDAVEEEDQPLAPPTFEYDRTFYATGGTYPAEDARTNGPAGMMGQVHVQPVGICPFKVNAATGELTVRTNMRLTFSHAGTPSAPVEMTKRGMRNLGAVIPNLPAHPTAWPINSVTYKGAFLFIVPPEKAADIEPLVKQKKERGFKVTVASTENIDLPPAGVTYSDVEAAINGWYYQNDAYPDKYVLLVGDHSKIPVAQSPLYPIIPWRGDFFYACVDNDYYQDVILGRITYTDSSPGLATLPEIVSRILAYEDTPVSSNYYREALMAGHQQADAGFVDNLKEIEATPFAQAPHYTNLFGTEPTGTTTSAFAEINEGKGIIHYRGHGSVNRWHEWDFNGEHLITNDFPSRFAPAHPTWSPIMINSACGTGAFQNSVDTLCEVMMESVGGAVATYGAGSTSQRDVNHLFSFNFFDLLYDKNMCGIGALCATAQLNAFLGFEWSPDVVNPDLIRNLFQYNLFGDPEMKVYRGNPDPLFCPGLPSNLPVGPQSLAVHVQSSSGAAKPGVLVAIYKDGELDSNAYADALGNVMIPVHATQPGVLSVRAIDDDLQTGGFRAEIRVRCRGDFNNSGTVNVQDIFDFLAAWFAGDPRADVNGTGGGANVHDIFDFLGFWFGGC